jgi:hypothetical protein
MDNIIFRQLGELAESFSKIGLKPVVCGGLSVYLHFYKSQDEAQRMIRTTNDVDLMLTPTQVLDKSHRNAIAKIITGTLNYIVCQDGKHFQFEKAPEQRLDILIPPIADCDISEYRVKLVKSKLHGHLTEEACFIEDDLKTINLSEFLPDTSNLEIAIPSLTNMLILKLFAFGDRYAGQRQDTPRASAHAWDIYIIATLANSADYHQGQAFLSRHAESDIIQKSQRIITDNFSDPAAGGWREVLGTKDFYPRLTRQERREKLTFARNRLMRWFNCPV